MIICVCHRLNCRKVDEAIAAGAVTPKAVQAHHGNQFQCGKCKPEICERLKASANEVQVQTVSSPIRWSSPIAAHG